jgi:hypothetical protein
VALIELETFIAAPPERCFELSLSVELHLDSTAATRERAIAGNRKLLVGRNALIKHAAEGDASRYGVGDSLL